MGLLSRATTTVTGMYMACLIRARVRNRASTPAVATCDVDGHEAQFRVASSSVQNLFRLPELEQFRCPGQS